VVSDYSKPFNRELCRKSKAFLKNGKDLPVPGKALPRTDLIIPAWWDIKKLICYLFQ
jgi:hypothetical protein